MQCACAILSFVACPALQYFPHYLINGTIFEKRKEILNIKCVFFSLQLLPETFLILGEIEADTIINVF